MHELNIVFGSAFLSTFTFFCSTALTVALCKARANHRGAQALFGVIIVFGMFACFASFMVMMLVGLPMVASVAGYWAAQYFL